MFEQLEQLAQRRAAEAVENIHDAESEFRQLAATMARDALPIDQETACDILQASGHSVAELKAAVKIHSLRFEGERCAKECSTLSERRIDLHHTFGKAEDEFAKVRAAHDEKQLELVGQIRDVENDIALAQAWFRDRDAGFDGRAFRELSASAPYEPTEAEVVSAQVQKAVRRDIQLQREMEENAAVLRVGVARLGEINGDEHVAAQSADEGALIADESGELMLYGAATGNVTFGDFIQAEGT